MYIYTYICVGEKSIGCWISTQKGKAKEKISKDWNYNNNAGLVVGATYPIELARVREIVGALTILIPGIGAQGADVGSTIRASGSTNVLISSSLLHFLFLSKRSLVSTHLVIKTTGDMNSLDHQVFYITRSLDFLKLTSFFSRDFPSFPNDFH